MARVWDLEAKSMDELELRAAPQEQPAGNLAVARRLPGLPPGLPPTPHRPSPCLSGCFPWVATGLPRAAASSFPLLGSGPAWHRGSHRAVCRMWTAQQGTRAASEGGLHALLPTPSSAQRTTQKELECPALPSGPQTPVCEASSPGAWAPASVQVAGSWGDTEGQGPHWPVPTRSLAGLSSSVASTAQAQAGCVIN